MRLRVLLVVRAGTEPRWTGPLDAAGILYEQVSGQQALQALREGRAAWVACARVPGWPALVRGAHDAGGRAILLGPAPDADERARVDQLALPSAGDPEALVTHLRTAERDAEALARDEADAAPSARALAERQLGRLAASLASQPNLTAIAEEAAARTREAVDAEWALLFLVDPTGALEPLPAPAVAVAPEHLALAQEVARSAQPWVGTRGGPCVAAPLVHGGDVLGALLAVRRPTSPPFTERELSFLSEACLPVSSAVQTALAHDGLEEARARLREGDQVLERRVQERTGLVVRAKREWEQTFDAIREPLSVQDGFVIRRANRAYAARGGVPIQQVPGMLCHRLLAGRDTPCEGCPLTEGASNPGEVAIRGARFVVSRFTHAGEADDWAVVHYRDVTEQHRLEARLRESERMASVGQLASGAAHEINNPLSFVISNLRSLKLELGELPLVLEQLEGLQRLSREDPQRAGEALANLRWRFDAADLPKMIDESLEGAARVAAIVKGLRDLSRLEIGAAEAASVTASVSRAIRAELGDLPSAVQSELGAVAPARLPPLQLDQVLGHLLRNARQAISPGSHIRIRTWDEPTEVLIEIADEGCGISPQHLGRIFEPFFTTRGVGQGIGLGLTSAYGIVQRHDGALEVRSEEGKGATFTLRLPRGDLPATVDPSRGAG